MKKNCKMCHEAFEGDYDDVFCPKCKQVHDWKYEKRKRNGKKSISLFKKWGYQNEKNKNR
ncbi:MAG: hypothetical protein Q8O89_01930 [Nanoarchaeota archaeon]|nr:hypothetical protein [Nanoarchaeota archaeon]